MKKTVLMASLASIVSFSLGLALRPFSLQNLNERSFARTNRINGATEIYKIQVGGKWTKVQHLPGWFGWTKETTEIKYIEKPSKTESVAGVDLIEYLLKQLKRYEALILLEEKYLTSDGRWTAKATDELKSRSKSRPTRLWDRLLTNSLNEGLPQQLLEERLSDMGADPATFTVPEKKPTSSE